MAINTQTVESNFKAASARFAELGVDADAALSKLAGVPISLHCWQGDDIGGFEAAASGAPGGGLAVTGNYPGRARTPDELRADLSAALGMIPGKHRVNLHALYAETGGKAVGRDALAPEHFSRWIDWAKTSKLHGLDFNPSYFAHPLAADGFTLTSRDDGRRQFWIQHGIVCRQIGAAMGKARGSPTLTNVWIPDGYKDTPADRKTPREVLGKSLDAVFAEKLDANLNLDAVEGKLFGIGTESYTVGSHEFYLGYCVRNGKVLTLDAGHYHPTESMADKISSVLTSLPRILLHVSRGVRWDSDHVVTWTDELSAVAQEIVRGEYLSRVHIGLDFFDASINRVAAWVIGTRNMQKALLASLLEPIAQLRKAEVSGDYTTRLALMEEMKTLPVGAVWDYFCLKHSAGVGTDWIDSMKGYERNVLSKRG